MSLDPRLALVRRWAVGWLAAADPAVAEEILAPDYAVAIGGDVITGRDAYMAATLGQLERFPGLGLTVHELLLPADGGRVALRFTEHGADLRRGGRLAAWSGVALLEIDEDGRLSRCWAQEDYRSRRRQLAGEHGEVGRGVDPIAPPAPSPWTTAPAPADPAAEAGAREWLRAGDPGGGVTVDDGSPPPRLHDASARIDALVSAGPRVAFAAHLSGDYVGGLDDDVGRDAHGRPAELHLAGIVTVADGAVRGGHVVSDRLGLVRSLRDATR